MKKSIALLALLLLPGIAQAAPTTRFGPGIHLVGIDIQAGLYRSEGGVDYFARLSGVSGDFGEIIANGIPSEDGPALVEILPEDAAFESTGDGEWYLVDDSYAPEIRISFGDGAWIVGVDILPGLYRTEDDVDYYARLSGFSGQLADILANNAITTGRITLQILDTDVGFETSGGAIWTRMDTTSTAVRSVTWGEVKTGAKIENSP